MLERSFTPDISIVIVNWNTRVLLQACLQSIPAGLSPSHSAEIWVVYNASADGSAEMIADQFPQVHVIANQENVGFARANNQAIRQAEGRYILLLNSDTLVLPEALSAMAEFMDSRPETGAVGCRLENVDGSTQRSCWSFYPSLQTLAAEAFYLWRIPGIRRWVRGHELSLTDPTSPTVVKHLLGACLMVRRTILETVGLMDEGYFMYLEETDWCRRIDAAGWTISYLPTASIIHYGQQSAGLAPDKANADWCRSMCRFFRGQDQTRPPQMGLVKTMLGITILIRFALNTVRGLLGRSRKPRPSLRGCLSALRALVSA